MALFKKILPDLDLGKDKTTEIVRVWLIVNMKNHHCSIDILNIYIPPINPSTDDTRQQLFDADHTFGPAVDDA